MMAAVCRSNVTGILKDTFFIVSFACLNQANSYHGSCQMVIELFFHSSSCASEPQKGHISKECFFPHAKQNIFRFKSPPCSSSRDSKRACNSCASRNVFSIRAFVMMSRGKNGKQRRKEQSNQFPLYPYPLFPGESGGFPSGRDSRSVVRSYSLDISVWPSYPRLAFIWPW